MNSLDVQEETSSAGAQFLDRLYDTLIEPDALADSPKCLPGLATIWRRVGPTATEFKLRQHVTFHDGSLLETSTTGFATSWTCE